MAKMEIKVSNIEVPWVEFGTKQGYLDNRVDIEVDYRQDVPEITLTGKRCWQENVFSETSQFKVGLTFLPQPLQDLWRRFKKGTEDWVKEQEISAK